MGQVVFPDDIHAPNMTCDTIKARSPCISNAMIEAGAAIAASKLVHRYNARHGQKGGTDVASETMGVHTFRAAGTIVAVEVVPLVAPTGGNKQFTVDVKLGNASTGSQGQGVLVNVHVEEQPA